LPDADKKDWFTFKSTMMASNATAMEIPAVIDYTAINTMTGISVTRKVALTTYFEHLQFVVPSCLEKTSDALLEEYDDANESDDQVYNKLESLFPIIGYPLTFYYSFCDGIVLVPVDVTGTNQDISTRARKAENIVRKEAKQKNADALQEFSNKRRCIQFEHNKRDQETAQSQLTTAPIRKKCLR
jgi:hypothetical protein